MNTTLTYHIRPIAEGDIEDIAELYTLFWNDHMNISRMEETLKKLSGNSAYIFLSAEYNGKVIGTIQGIVCEELYGDCRPFLVMENFVVGEQFRGQGVGKKLLTELERIGKERNCTQIIFITETNRKDTVTFYEKLGFNSVTHKGFKKALS